MNRKLILVYLILGATIIPLRHFCTKKTAGFSIARITFALPKGHEPCNFDKKILNQKFYFLGHGGQCFAFVSQDGKYVLKLMSRGITPAFLLDWHLPSFLKKAAAKRVARVEKGWQRDLNSYLLAFNELKQETGLIHLHLTETNTIGTKLTIVDKLGIAHAIDLDKTAFILQAKAEMLLPYLQRQINNDQMDAAKATLEKTVSLLRKRCQLGIFDEDPRLHKNLGFVGDEPIFVDVGRFKRDSARKQPDVYERDLIAITARLRSWLANEDPSTSPLLIKHLDSLVTSQ